MRLARYLYQAAMASSLAVAAPFLLVRRGSHYLETLPGRLGFHAAAVERPPGGALWVHAVSVGEVAVAATLAGALPESLPLLVTTVTPTGQQRARELFADSGRGSVAYLPFDLGFTVGSFFRRFAPAALVLVEGDYWPLVLAEAGRRQIPVAVVNGRVGERAFRRMERAPGLCRRLFFSSVAAFGVQTAEDERRLILSGAAAERIRVTGNLKFDTPPPARNPQLEGLVRGLAAERPILVAGSTMAGEEESVLDAFRQLGGGERALLVLAPRHPERCDPVAELLRRQQLLAVRRSALDEGAGAGRPAPEVLLLDSLGELAALYAVADAAFVGGTLVPTGGHNPLEPAHFAVPVAAGPSMENFRQIAAAFESAGAWQRVADGRALAAAWDAWLVDPAAARAVGERGKDLLLGNRGALGRTLELLAPLLAAVKGSRG